MRVKLTPEQEATIVEYARDHLARSYCSIGEKFGVPKLVVKRLCRAAGLEPGVSLEQSGLAEFEREAKKHGRQRT
jgi:hypothetical protein